jgi:hypothetical protein
MKRQRTNKELADAFTLSPKELDLIGDSKTDHTLLGFAVLLKYYQYEGRFPAQKQDVPPVVILHLAQQLGLVPEKIIPYDWEGRSIKAHRAAIRRFLDVRASLVGLRRNSRVFPWESTARYRYTHTFITFTYVSSTRHESFIMLKWSRQRFSSYGA